MKTTIQTPLRGRTLLNDATLNKGTAFTAAERTALGLDALLPPRVESIEDQQARIADKYQRLHDDLERHVFLRALQDTNEVLFYRFVTEHLHEVLPIVYTPTVGAACQEFSHIYRRPQGLFLRLDHRNAMDAQLASAQDGVEVIVVTDGERVLGLGDQGLGGMGIPIGKLSLYSAVGGIDPRRTLPIFLDVGTNNPALLDDPLYLGARHERVDGEEYFSFVEEFVDAVKQRYPGVLLQWEDFAQHHATELLHRHRDRILSFNDDIQGTAAVALAAVQAAISATESSLDTARTVIVGAGSAGTGIAAMLTGAGLRRENLHLVDAAGLLHSHRNDLADYQRPFTQQWPRIEHWANHDGPTDLASVVESVHPTVLIGVSGQPGLFTESIVASMAAHAPAPIILPLSNPTDRAEANPSDLLRWTGGRALVATGSPFGDVTHDGGRRVISQSNNIYVFPGLGAGALAVKASAVTDAMLRAAAASVAVASPCTASAPTGGLLPPLKAVGDVSARIARAVAIAARDDGVADDVDDDEIETRVAAATWHPEYPEIVPA